MIIGREGLLLPIELHHYPVALVWSEVLMVVVRLSLPFRVSNRVDDDVAFN